MLKVEDIFSKLYRAKYFTTLDLRAGYHPIPLDKSSIPKTAFNSPFRKYEYVKVPFGLAQAPAYFQELMTGILKDFNFVIAYLDDIIIFSRTPEKWNLKWRPVCIECDRHYLHIENQAMGKTRSCNKKDIVLKPPIEFWNIGMQFGRAGKYINHPANLPTITLNNQR